MNQPPVFLLSPTDSDFDIGRPEIDDNDPRNQGPAWESYRQRICLREQDAVTSKPTAQATKRDISGWHAFYAITHRCFSADVRSIIDEICPGQVTWFPVTINGIGFHTPYFEQFVDALDWERADARCRPGREDDFRYWHVNLYAFRPEAIRDPMIFTMKESAHDIFVTETLAVALERRKFRGLQIMDAWTYNTVHPKHVMRTVEEVLGRKIV